MRQQIIFVFGINWRKLDILPKEKYKGIL